RGTGRSITGVWFQREHTIRATINTGRDMVDPQLLEILCCPETRQDVTLAPAGMIEDLNRRIEAGALVNRAGEPVREKLDAGLLRADGAVLYPIREDIPVMLVEEAIPL